MDTQFEWRGGGSIGGMLHRLLGVVRPLQLLLQRREDVFTEILMDPPVLLQIWPRGVLPPGLWHAGGREAAGGHPGL